MGGIFRLTQTNIENKGEYIIMKRITTTKKINEAITNNLLQIMRAEVHYKTSNKTEIIDADEFYEDFSFLCESGCFANALGWHYERDIKSKGYIAETGRMDRSVETIVTVYLTVCNGVCRENVEKTLSVSEEE